MGAIVPSLLATFLGIPFRIIDCNTKMYQPLRALSVSPIHGVAASHSVLFATKGPLTTMRALFTLCADQGLLRLTGLLVLLSGLLVPISCEAIRIVAQGNDCQTGHGNAQNCAITLGVFPIPAQITVAILATMAALLMTAAVLLRKWKTGVSAQVWNMTESSVELHPRFTALLNRLSETKGVISNKNVSEAFGNNRYTFETWSDGGQLRRGIVVLGSHSPLVKNKRLGEVDESSLEAGRSPASPKRPTMPAFILSITGRLLILLLLIGLTIHIAIYPELRNSGDSFANFMDSESLALRLLFSGVGITITMFWTSYFQCKAISSMPLQYTARLTTIDCALISPYKMLDMNPDHYTEVHELDPPTNPFSALIRILLGRQSDFYLGIVAAVSILSEFLPTLLANVPHRVVETYIAHVVCMWLSVALLSVMALTIMGSFFVKWPHMPIDPTTLVGSLYYTVHRSSRVLQPKN